jgi:hypothetical protein
MASLGIVFRGRSTWLLPLLFFFQSYCLAQVNLINNPSFEATEIPYSEILPIGCIGGNVMNFEPNAPGSFHWIDPYNGSTDCFNTCQCGLPWNYIWCVPQNKWGFQQPRTGNGYVGIHNYSPLYLAPHPFGNFITGPLKKTLERKKTYCVQYFASLPDTCNSACNNLDAVFTNHIPIPDDVLLYQLNPQIANTLPLTDKENWMEIRGSFIAEGFEKFITIGNFRKREDTDTIVLYPPPDGHPWPYQSGYYLDDVSVYELKALHSYDTLICPQASYSFSLKAYPGFDSYLWSNGDTNRITNITQPGTYWVTASNWCGTVTDTIVVKIMDTLAIQNALGLDKSLCAEQFPYTLYPLPQYENLLSNFNWSTGSDSVSTLISNAGVYTLSAHHQCGSIRDSILVTVLPSPQLNLGNDPLLCRGQSVLLDAGEQSFYSWSTGDSARSISVNEAGVYSVLVSNSFNCVAQESILISME